MKITKHTEEYYTIRNELLDLLESWDKKGYDGSTCLSAALSIFIKAAFEIAPCMHATQTMFGEAFLNSVDEQEEQ